MKKKLTKNLILIMAVVMLCFAVSMTASAETEGYYTYEIVDGNAIITDVDTAISGDVIIPDTLGGYPVTEICDRAFSSCYSLENIYIPDSVKSIGDAVFWRCISLEKITVSEDNDYYCSDEYGVLYNIEKTELIQYPNGSINISYSIPDSVNLVHTEAFARTTNLVEIKIPNNILIDELAFEVCYRLEKISFPEVANNIELALGSFAYCFSLDKVKIPAGVTLQNWVFQECYGLREVYISNNVEKIGDGAIVYTPYLEKIYVEGLTTQLGDYTLGATECTVSELSREELIELAILANSTDPDAETYFETMINSLQYHNTLIHTGTIYGHKNSTAETYANTYNANFISTHFYEDEWTYDYDNLIKYRKCIHCDECETETIEPELPTEPEIPTEPDTPTEPDVPAEPDIPVEPDTPAKPDTPATPQKANIITKIFDFINTFFALVISWLNR